MQSKLSGIPTLLNYVFSHTNLKLKLALNGHKSTLVFASDDHKLLQLYVKVLAHFANE